MVVVETAAAVGADRSVAGKQSTRSPRAVLSDGQRQRVPPFLLLIAGLVNPIFRICFRLTRDLTP